MITRIAALLILSSLLGFSHVAQAQLPIRNSRWQGTILTDVRVFLTFRSDTLYINSQADRTPIETMQYEQLGDTLTIRKIAGQNPCGTSITGFYRIAYLNNGEQFSILPIRDDCLERQNSFDAKTLFTRVRSSANQPPRNWPYLDPAADSVAGMSLYKAYALLKGLTPTPVIVGVLDSGVDLAHEDLKDVIWTNPKEIPGNGTDDDKNGYADDINGWNFMGAKDGTTYEYDQPEITQTYLLLKAKYDRANPARLSPYEKRQYDTYQAAKKQYLQRYQAGRPKRLAFADTARFWRIANQLSARLPGTGITRQTIRAVDLGRDSAAIAIRNVLADVYDPQYGTFDTYLGIIRENWTRFRQLSAGEAEIAFNPDYSARKAVGDDPTNPTERYYGSPTMRIGQSQQLAVHGSHVAGIIGAKRGNGRGIDGVADAVRIMPVSVVPANGDERDKDVANGIRYAVENGAKVINMSFGKRLSPFKAQVDAAIRFAEEQDVLIVHAAGNNGENYDSIPAYPSARYENGQVAQNVLVVGNSTWRIGSGLPSRSSNYGVETVDLFAPGTEILSTLPNNQYASFSGTSMAAPNAAGVAALLRAYFPKLSAVQVKDILLRSSYKPEVMVRKPGRSADMVPFKNLSRSGGLLNAYEAVKLAMGM
ncbi:S8 family serine peptidase [Spirosoma fluminis]